jgi:hypothetical protein
MPFPTIAKPKSTNCFSEVYEMIMKGSLFTLAGG